MTLVGDDLLKRFRGLTVAVIGDVIADRYVFTEPVRLSREAPVLVVRHQADSVILGGAANTVNNLVALGARVLPFGVIGNDDAGASVVEAFQRLGVEAAGLVCAETRRTVAKTRILAGDPNRTKQQLLRIDHEPDAPPDQATMLELARRIRAGVAQADCLLFSDYGYEVVTADVIAAARGAFRGRVQTADSRYRVQDFRGVTMATPNESEAAEAAGFAIRDEASLERAGRLLLEQFASPALMITRGNRGLAVFEPGRARVDIPATGTAEVTDVSGAGDTVIAVATLALGAGCSFVDAARASNAAAGVVVMKPGAAVCTPAEFLAAMSSAP